MSEAACPFCGAELHPNPRYPVRLCRACIARAQAADRRPLTFSNVSIGGGFLARYTDSGEEHDSHDCWVDGRKCRADEEYMGTIVVIPAGGTDG